MTRKRVKKSVRRSSERADEQPVKPLPPAAAIKPAISNEAFMRLAQATRTKPGMDWNPYTAAAPLPGVVPRGWSPKRVNKTTMAMDDASGGISNAVPEYLTTGLYSQGWTFMGYSYLSELAQIAEYRSISETIALEMTKKWIQFKAEDEESASAAEEEYDDDRAKRIKIIKKRLEHHSIQQKMRWLIEYDGYMGRSHLGIRVAGDDDRDEAMSPIGNGTGKISRAKVNPRRPVRAFRCIEPVWTYPKNYNSNDPMNEDWYNPTSWFVMAKEWNSTRLLRYMARPVPDILKPAYTFGGLSLSQMAKPYVDNWLRTRQSVSDIVHSFSVFVLGTDLQTSLMADGDQLFRRLELFNILRDNMGVFAVNKDSETFSNVAAPLGSLDALQAQSQEHMASVVREPITKLFGIQPVGLNASDENQLRNFEETVTAAQTNQATPTLQTIINFIQLSEFGDVDEDIKWEWTPLRSMTEKEQSEIQKSKADTHQVYLDMGAIGPDEVRKAVAADPDSPYEGLNVEELPEPQVEPGELHERVEAESEPPPDDPGEEAPEGTQVQRTKVPGQNGAGRQGGNRA